ncbi:uncharacterized protein DEA37_0004281 [Paragonimus westermani]|uniref:Uncharacterized protein n=1 Tax=Paragonimus westermani TaxID=34504 RepID=A0A5J4N3D9_9TREM|nr:uncharacterized protein DEA37_0004281 [Paragonimus westermani]
MHTNYSVYTTTKPMLPLLANNTSPSHNTNRVNQPSRNSTSLYHTSSLSSGQLTKVVTAIANLLHQSSTDLDTVLMIVLLSALVTLCLYKILYKVRHRLTHPHSTQPHTLTSQETH